MSVARRVLAGLFGGAKVGTEGLVRRKAEERARMERQQEQAANREFDLEMMRERQAAQRAAARRSALQAKLDRNQRQEEQAALAASRAAEAGYRERVLAGQREDRRATAAQREAEAALALNSRVMSDYLEGQKQQIDAFGVPFNDEQKRTEMARLTRFYGLDDDQAARIFENLPDFAMPEEEPETPVPSLYEQFDKENEDLPDDLTRQDLFDQQREIDQFYRDMSAGRGVTISPTFRRFVTENPVYASAGNSMAMQGLAMDALRQSGVSDPKVFIYSEGRERDMDAEKALLDTFQGEMAITQRLRNRTHVR